MTAHTECSPAFPSRAVRLPSTHIHHTMPPPSFHLHHPPISPRHDPSSPLLAHPNWEMAVGRGTTDHFSSGPQACFINSTVREKASRQRMLMGVNVGFKATFMTSSLLGVFMTERPPYCRGRGTLSKLSYSHTMRLKRGTHKWLSACQGVLGS